jgi:hypothetical protein
MIGNTPAPDLAIAAPPLLGRGTEAVIPDPWIVPWKPDFDDIVTTLAIGEEAGPDPIERFPPWEPEIGWATTLAIGEEEPPLDTDVLLG